MNEKHMPKSYWAEVACTTIYVMNQCTSSGVHLDLSRLKVFDSIAFVHIPNEKRKKLDSKLEKCILMGYSLEQKQYKCFNPSTQKVRVSWDVVFDESTSWYEPNSSTSEPIEEELDINLEVDIRPKPITRESPSSSMTSEPQEPPNNQSTPWTCVGSNKGKVKMPEYEDNHSTSAESNMEGLTHSIDNDFGVPIMRTPRVKEDLTLTNERLCRSSREKKLLMLFSYTKYMAHHYAFMMQVAIVGELEGMPTRLVIHDG